jgi:hypothetical protein
MDLSKVLCRTDLLIWANQPEMCWNAAPYFGGQKIIRFAKELRDECVFKG